MTCSTIKNWYDVYFGSIAIKGEQQYLNFRVNEFFLNHKLLFHPLNELYLILYYTCILLMDRIFRRKDTLFKNDIFNSMINEYLLIIQLIFNSNTFCKLAYNEFFEWNFCALFWR